MPHLTFIHGIANKPASDKLVDIWCRALAADAHGIDLGANGITSSMVYWADVLYEKPDENVAAYERTGIYESLGADVTLTNKDVDMSWREEIVGLEKVWADTLAAKLGSSDPLVNDDAEPAESEIGTKFERVPLPWWLKRRLMKAYLRDVHHYLFNVEYSPRTGTTYRVQDEIRNRTISALKEGAKKPGPHILVSHSMGTVIAYDCLKRVATCPPVDELMTIGSPLGFDEIQDKLAPEWTRGDGFPRERLKGRWINIYDHLDPVAGFDPVLANDYQRNSEQVVEDIHEPNWGKWRHNISKYLKGAQLRAILSQLLGL